MGKLCSWQLVLQAFSFVFVFFSLVLLCSLFLVYGPLAAFGVEAVDGKARPFSLGPGFSGGEELASPGDWVLEEDILVYSNRVVLDIDGASWASFTNTNSMDPFLDETANAIEILPEDPLDIQVGDVISYESEFGVIIHRVVEVGEDFDGVYYIVKGDNNAVKDPVKVRFDDVVGVLVAIVY